MKRLTIFAGYDFGSYKRGYIYTKENNIKNYPIKIIINHLNRIVNIDKIKFLYPRFKKFNFCIINKKFINIFSEYLIDGRYRIILKFINKIQITIDLPKKNSYIEYGYKNFNFLIDL